MKKTAAQLIRLARVVMADEGNPLTVGERYICDRDIDGIGGQWIIPKGSVVEVEEMAQDDHTGYYRVVFKVVELPLPKNWTRKSSVKVNLRPDITLPFIRIPKRK